LTPNKIKELNYYIIQKLSEYRTGKYIERGKRFLSYVNGSLTSLYLNNSVFREYREFLYSKEFLEKLNGHHPDHTYSDLILSANGSDDIERLAEAMIGSWLPDDILVKVDIATMSNSLELRSPLLDQSFMEYMASVKPEKKLNYNQPKYILRKVHEKYFPKWISAKKKQGFSIPLDKWLRNDMKKLVKSTLLNDDMVNSKLFKFNSVKRIVDEHMQGKSHGHRIWALLCFQLWNQKVYSNDIGI
jgi:asparagine synthase (glutamine-hydrolysing)